MSSVARFPAVAGRCLLVFLILVALCFALVLYIIVTTHPFMSSAEAVPQTQAALVLGASVTSAGVLSAVLQERADAAIVLYNAHKVAKILVTGDDSTLVYDEVYPVGKYLAAAGVPKQDIFLDYAGFDTYSSMYRARDVFGVTSLVVITQRFHLPRAVFIARSLGLVAYGVDAGKPGELYFANALREIPASVKALGDLLFARVPKYLGPQFPIGGEGSATWVGSEAELIYFKSGN
ncbi:MAG: ElyC/SanA/YdcF family protein [bacterium]|nr:ElyC/SanA/YdcF family protein [bacterium]